jgi:hypothetical protein
VQKCTALGKIVRVQESRSVRVVLELDPEGETIQGSLSDALKGHRPFQGWLELASALEAVRKAREEPRARHCQRAEGS